MIHLFSMKITIFINFQDILHRHPPCHRGVPDEPPAARAQRLLEGFPKPPQPPQPAQPVSQGEDAIEDFPEDPILLGPWSM
jgi:hypothetical protein